MISSSLFVLSPKTDLFFEEGAYSALCHAVWSYLHDPLLNLLVIPFQINVWQKYKQVKAKKGNSKHISKKL
jgi:hypothetical protein